MNSIVIDNVNYSYIINYKKIKNINFRIKDDGIIYVSCNQYISKLEIEKILINNKKFILSAMKRLEAKKVLSNKIFYLGNELTFIESDKCLIDNDYIYAKNIDDAKEYIYSLAYDVFLERLNFRKATFKNLPEFRLRVRKMSTRWGVCNRGSMTVTLNTELITKDVNLIDYVIVHELSHFDHMNHSKEFWDEVARHYPYYKQARKELNSR